MRADGRLEHDAAAQRLPRVGTPVREEGLADAPRGQLVARVAEDADADDRDVEVVTVDLRDAADRPLRNASLADDTVDACDHLGAVRQRHRARVELLEVAEAKVHAVQTSQ